MYSSTSSTGLSILVRVVVVSFLAAAFLVVVLVVLFLFCCAAKKRAEDDVDRRRCGITPHRPAGFAMETGFMVAGLFAGRTRPLLVMDGCSPAQRSPVKEAAAAEEATTRNNRATTIPRRFAVMIIVCRRCCLCMYALQWELDNFVKYCINSKCNVQTYRRP